MTFPVPEVNLAIQRDLHMMVVHWCLCLHSIASMTNWLTVFWPAGQSVVLSSLAICWLDPLASSQKICNGYRAENLVKSFPSPFVSDTLERQQKLESRSLKYLQNERKQKRSRTNGFHSLLSFSTVGSKLATYFV